MRDASVRLPGLPDGGQLMEAAYAAALQGAQNIAREAGALCPRDTGELAASIGVRADRQAGALEVYASSSHAIFVELGTASAPAQPFMYPAYAMHRDALVRGVGQAVLEAIREGG